MAANLVFAVLANFSGSKAAVNAAHDILLVHKPDFVVVLGDPGYKAGEATKQFQDAWGELKTALPECRMVYGVPPASAMNDDMVSPLVTVDGHPNSSCKAGNSAQWFMPDTFYAVDRPLPSGLAPKNAAPSEGLLADEARLLILDVDVLSRKSHPRYQEHLDFIRTHTAFSSLGDIERVNPKIVPNQDVSSVRLWTATSTYDENGILQTTPRPRYLVAFAAQSLSKATSEVRALLRAAALDAVFTPASSARVRRSIRTLTMRQGVDVPRSAVEASEGSIVAGWPLRLSLPRLDVGVNLAGSLSFAVTKANRSTLTTSVMRMQGSSFSEVSTLAHEAKRFYFDAPDVLIDNSFRGAIWVLQTPRHYFILAVLGLPVAGVLLGTTAGYVSKRSL